MKEEDLDASPRVGIAETISRGSNHLGSANVRRYARVVRKAIGRVIDAVDGRGVPGATVEAVVDEAGVHDFVIPDREGAEGDIALRQTTTSAESGEFFMESVPSGRQDGNARTMITVSARGYESLGPFPATTYIAADVVDLGIVALRPLAPSQFRVVDQAGAPVSGARCFVVPYVLSVDGGSFHTVDWDAPDGIADSRGYVVLHGQPVVSERIVVMSDGCIPTSVDWSGKDAIGTISVLRRRPVPIRVVANEPFAIEPVRLELGVLVDSMDVQVMIRRPQSSLVSDAPFLWDSDLGRVSLTAKLTTDDAEYRAASTDLELAVDPGDLYELRVRRHRARAVAVWDVPDDAGAVNHRLLLGVVRELVKRERTDYMFGPSLGAGELSVFLPTDRPCRFVSFSPVAGFGASTWFLPGRSDEPIRIDWSGQQNLGDLVVHVVDDAEVEPIPDAIVELTASLPPDLWPPSTQQQSRGATTPVTFVEATDGVGRAEFSGVPRGEWRIRTSRGAFRTDDRTVIGGLRVEERVFLTREGSCSLSIRLENSNVLLQNFRNVRVSIEGPIGGEAASIQLPAGHDGVVERNGLMPGVYSIRVFVPSNLVDDTFGLRNLGEWWMQGLEDYVLAKREVTVDDQEQVQVEVDDRGLAPQLVVRVDQSTVRARYVGILSSTPQFLQSGGRVVSWTPEGIYPLNGRGELRGGNMPAGEIVVGVLDEHYDLLHWQKVRVGSDLVRIELEQLDVASGTIAIDTLEGLTSRTVRLIGVGSVSSGVDWLTCEAYVAGSEIIVSSLPAGEYDVRVERGGGPETIGRLLSAGGTLNMVYDR